MPPTAPSQFQAASRFPFKPCIFFDVHLLDVSADPGLDISQKIMRGRLPFMPSPSRIRIESPANGCGRYQSWTPTVSANLMGVRVSPPLIMFRQPMSKPAAMSTNPDIIASAKALRRAACRALEIGRRKGIPVYVLKKGRIVDMRQQKLKRARCEPS
jgi:hypothetical protein